MQDFKYLMWDFDFQQKDTTDWLIVNIIVTQVSYWAGSCWCASTISGEATLPKDNVRRLPITCFTN